MPAGRRMTRAGSALADGRAALDRRDWAAARDAFTKALAAGESAEAYEGLSWVARVRNDTDGLFRAREAAFKLYRDGGDDSGAARMAMWLGADYADYRGELSIASGWRQRARRLLESLETCEEHAWLAVIEGDTALLYEADPDAALQAAGEIKRVARELQREDIAMRALSLEGLALVYRCEFAEGMTKLDEAAVSALSDPEQHPLWVTWTLCYLLCACEMAHDFPRAVEWCRRAREYAERFDISSAQAICRLHYASALVWRGDWVEAEEQIREAASMLQESVPWVAEAQVRLAELRRLQGRTDEAREMYTQAEWHPFALFGLAELALGEGKPRDAAELVDRALRQTPESNRYLRTIALELQVRAQSLISNHARARAALAELGGIAGREASAPLRAASHSSAAVLAVQARDYERAAVELEDALTLFRRAGAAYEAARARLELASVLVELGRLDRARAEATSALDVLQTLGSRLQAGRAAALLENIERRTGSGYAGATRGILTARQVEILKLIACGNSDREIAGRLGLSEHTVHRHVANILLRLELPTRAAASARAASLGLI